VSRRPGARVRPHRGLPFRLLALSLAVCAVSVVATAWLVVRSIGIQQQESAQTLAKDREVYVTLMTWAQEHGGWDDVQGLTRRLGDGSGYRVALTTLDGTVVADSTTDDGRPSPRRAALDPADARTLLDPQRLDALLAVDLPTPTPEPSPTPDVPAPDVTTPDVALRDGAGSDVALRDDARPDAVPVPAPDPEARELVADVLRERAQAATEPAAAPVVEPLLLHLTPQDAVASTFVDLSDRNRLRILAIAAAVLLVATTVSLVVGSRMTRPLRALAAAAGRMSAGEVGTRVRVGGRDEIGAVAVAFNAMAESREQQEAARKAMVSDVAHELRSPLSIIRGQVEAAQDGLVDLDPALLASLHEEAVTLHRVVDDLQVLALADAGALRLHRERVDLGEAVRQQVAAARAAAGPGAPRLTCTVTGASAGAVDVDPVRVRQVLGNLLSNALRHTGADGEVRVELDAGPTATVLTVQDTGAGIPADRVAHVFDRFYRADPSRSRTTGGSGLGLAIVRDIVELHGGTVTLTSEEGVGTRVVVAVPTQDEEDPTVGAP
jgi:two-component system sensor histidine kinase BaeS